MPTRWTRQPKYFRQTQQTTLGKSVNGNLAIQKTIDANDSFVDSSRPAFILRLPDEVLRQILELAITETDGWHKESPYSKALIPAVAYTCHRFSRIVISFNYHTLRMEFPRRMIYPVCSTRKLVQSLQANPSLGRFCQNLSLSISDICPRRCKTDSECLQEILPELKNVKYITVHGGFEPGSKSHTWDIIQRCSQHMPRLEQVLLSREAFTGPGYADILQNLQIPMLQELHIHGSSESNNGSLDVEVAKPVKASDLTKLHLSDFKDTSATLNSLIHWPKSLFEFSIENIHSDPDHEETHPNYLDLPLLRKMLNTHKDTLTSLSIGPLSLSGRGNLATLSDLTALHTLSLSRWQLGGEGELDVSSDFASDLLGPSLKLFIWDFTRYDGNVQRWSDFGTRESLWIMNLAQKAVELRVPLREIRIQFSPELPTSEDEDYPWDSVEDLNLQFREQGIVITYNEPVVLKEDFFNRSKPTE
ncbi:hypothetical protein N7490_011744 [Penicillium lividum]|nr:hypothetical protein N7490_011744 [Penicillium lividum]